MNSTEKRSNTGRSTQARDAPNSPPHLRPPFGRRSKCYGIRPMALPLRGDGADASR